MPTYRNDGTGSYKVTNIHGEGINVRPGNTVETYYLFTDDGNPWTKVSETPYYNPVKVYGDISITTSESKTVDFDSEKDDAVEIHNSSDSATAIMKFNSTGNTPGLTIPPGGLRRETGLNRKVHTLVLEARDANISVGELEVTVEKK